MMLHFGIFKRDSSSHRTLLPRPSPSTALSSVTSFASLRTRLAALTSFDLLSVPARARASGDPPVNIYS